jgi:hypothetical protein
VLQNSCKKYLQGTSGAGYNFSMQTLAASNASSLPGVVTTAHSRPRRYRLTVVGDMVWFTRLTARGAPAAEAFSWSVADVTSMLAAGRLAPVLH